MLNQFLAVPVSPSKTSNEEAYSFAWRPSGAQPIFQELKGELRVSVAK